MPLFRDGRPLKRWRYVGVYGPEMMLCAAEARIGPLPHRFWALAQPGQELLGGSTFSSRRVRVAGPVVAVKTPEVRFHVTLDEQPGVECLSPSGAAGYVWTRKQAGVRARAAVEIDGRERLVDAEAVIDETAGYHERHTTWRWSAGVGCAQGGERVAWNLVAGVNDGPVNSERTVWVDGEPIEIGPVEFAGDLSSVSFGEGGSLRFFEWAALETRTNLLLVRSSYRQPFGTFAGDLPVGLRLAEGYGVMEEHDAWW